MRKEVDCDLYDFLRERETGLLKNYNEVIAFAHIKFDDLKEFIDIVGRNYFDNENGGLEVLIQGDNICIDLNDIFEYFGHGISNYKNCFDKDDYKQYEKEILEMEE